MTPEQRMRSALTAASLTRARTHDPIYHDIGPALIEHGAAAIRAAVAEKKARIVSWLRADFDAARPPIALADLIDAGEPEAWAERTGWKAP